MGGWFLEAYAFMTNFRAKETNSIAKGTNSFANGMNSIAQNLFKRWEVKTYHDRTACETLIGQ